MNSGPTHILDRCVCGGSDMTAMCDAIDRYVASGDHRAVAELTEPRFLGGRDERYLELIAPLMCRLPEAAFDMGTAEDEAQHFCGETPRHGVELSPFDLTRVPVTVELFAHFDASVAAPDRVGASHPMVGISWLEASLFAIWVGCRLPTEAEWEYACGLGSPEQWACDARELREYAWYSESTSGDVKPVATRRPNAAGLCDLHGNVWEWCADAYDDSYYARSPLRNPFNAGSAMRQRRAGGPHRVCRGGSTLGLAEMCRTRYRLHEPPSFSARDLGFRLARTSCNTDRGEGQHGHDHLSLAAL